MKGKRYTTEEKIGLLRETDRKPALTVAGFHRQAAEGFPQCPGISGQLRDCAVPLKEGCQVGMAGTV